MIFWAFLGQVLTRHASCRQALAGIMAWWRSLHPTAALPAANTGAYCKARRRLDDALLVQIGQHVVTRLQQNLPTDARWRGRRVKLLDGTSASMPDTVENQAVWPQPTRQKAGCGFPVVRLVGLLCQGSGAWLGVAAGDLATGESTLARPLLRTLEEGDVLVSDRGFGSYLNLALITGQKAAAVVRLHAARRVDFAQGQRLGEGDCLVTWERPRVPARGCTAAEWAALPATLTLRLVRYRVEIPGFRTREVTLATTLLAADAFPAQALAELYAQRWEIEGHFRESKVLLGLDVLRCQSPEMVRKELALQQIAYNLIRLLLQHSALLHHVPLRRLSFKGALDGLHRFAAALGTGRRRPRRQRGLWDSLLATIAQDLLPERPHRAEPRVRKRRPKNYTLLGCPRAQMKATALRQQACEKTTDPA